MERGVFPCKGKGCCSLCKKWVVFLVMGREGTELPKRADENVFLIMRRRRKDYINRFQGFICLCRLRLLNSCESPGEGGGGSV